MKILELVNAMVRRAPRHTRVLNMPEEEGESMSPLEPNHVTVSIRVQSLDHANLSHT